MIRISVIAVLVVAGVASAQAPSRLPPNDCKAVAVLMGQVFEALPPQTLSQPFRATTTAFVRSRAGCRVPHRVEIASDADAAALRDLSAQLAALASPVDLAAAWQIVDLRLPPPGQTVVSPQ